MKFKKETVIYLDEKSKKEAYITIEEEDNDVYNITHTFVSEEHRGEGLAGRLMEEGIKFIKTQNGKIKSDCSYGVFYMNRKNIEYIK